MENKLNRPVRVLVAKVGLDGHDRGANFNCNFRETFDTLHNPVRRRYRRKINKNLRALLTLNIVK